MRQRCLRPHTRWTSLRTCRDPGQTMASTVTAAIVAEVFQDFSIDFWWEDAASALGDLASHGRRWVDIWYLDASTKNQRCHVERYGIRACNSCQVMARSSHRLPPRATSGVGSTRLDSTSQNDPDSGANANVSPTTQETGTTKPRQHPGISPLLSKPHHLQPRHNRSIIGAGIAGVQVARQLAERGCRVRFLMRRAATELMPITGYYLHSRLSQIWQAT